MVGNGHVSYHDMNGQRMIKQAQIMRNRMHLENRLLSLKDDVDNVLQGLDLTYKLRKVAGDSYDI